MSDETPLDLDAIRARTSAVSQWIVQAWSDCPGSWDAQTAVKTHLNTDIPNLLAEVGRQGRLLAAMAKDAAEQAEHMGELLDAIPDVSDRALDCDECDEPHTDPLERLLIACWDAVYGDKAYRKHHLVVAWLAGAR